MLAVVDRGELTIDAYHENTGDKAFYRGHYYAVGSIGPSLLALPAYLAARPVLAAFPPDQREQAALYMMTLLGAAMPGALLGLCVYAFARRFTRHEGHALLLALTYGLATPAFAYSKALLQHQASALGAFAGFYLLWRVVRERAAPWRLYAVGGLFGLSAVSEYPVALFLAMIFLWAWVEAEDRRLFLRVVWGALPLLLLFAAYNQVIFGTPLPVGYRYHVEYQAVHARGFMGITQPSWAALFGITLSPYRGLLWVSPVLALAAPGLVLMWRHARERLMAVLLSVITLGFVLYVASYEYWSGGDAIGPRFLVPLVPFLTIPMACAFDAVLGRRGGAWVVGTLIVLSLANVWAQSVAGHRYPPEEFRGAVVTNPTVQWALPLLREGQVAGNLGMILGLSGLASLLPLGVLAAAAVVAVRRRVAQRLGPEARAGTGG